MILYIKKGMFTIWAKGQEQRNNTEQHKGTQKTAVLHPNKLDEKNNPKYLVYKNNCVPLQHE